MTKVKASQHQILALSVDKAESIEIGLDHAVVLHWLRQETTLSKLVSEGSSVQNSQCIAITPEMVTLFFPMFTPGRTHGILHNLALKFKKIHLVKSHSRLYVSMAKDKPADFKPAKKKTEIVVKEDVTYTTETGDKVTVPETKFIATIIDAFSTVNPRYADFFSRKGERESISVMLTQYTADKILQMVSVLPTTNNMQWAPIITTPRELYNKGNKLIIFMNRLKAEEDGKDTIEVLL